MPSMTMVKGVDWGAMFTTACFHTSSEGPLIVHIGPPVTPFFCTQTVSGGSGGGSSNSSGHCRSSVVLVAEKVLSRSSNRSSRMRESSRRSNKIR